MAFTIAAAFAYTGYQKAMKAAKAAMERQGGLVYQVRSTTASRRVIYGIARVGGIEAYVVSGTSGGPTPGNGENNLINFILIWGDGPCKSIRNIQLNGVDVPLVDDDGLGQVWRPVAGSQYAGHLRIEHRLGDHTTATGVGVVHGWESTDKLHKICHSWVEMLYDKDIFPSGIVSTSAVVEGRNDIIDPRDDSTGWTDNPALCWAHYMALPKLGPSVDYATKLGEDELIAAANICDEDVDGAKRYTFNGVIQMEDDPEDNIQRFRTAMAGSTVHSGGKWRIYAGAYITPTFEITEDMVISSVKGQSKTGRSEHVNIVRGLYVAEVNNWQPTDFPAVTNPAYVTADGGQELPTDIDLPDTLTAVMARRIASIELERARRMRRINITCNIEALRAQAALPVLFHFPALGYDHQPMDVVEWGLTVAENKITIALSLRETDSAIYDPPEVIEPTIFVPEVFPPVYYRRVVSMRWENFLAINSPIFVLAAQPTTAASSFRVEFAHEEAGPFKPMRRGIQPDWALPVSLEEAVEADDVVVKVKLLPDSAGGANPRRSAYHLTSYSGNGDHDELLLILLAIDGSNAISAQEILSVDGAPTDLGSDVYDVPVLRGRKYSTAIAFATGSFPDAFANYEGWIIPRASLRAQWHQELLPDLVTLVRPSFWVRYTPQGLGRSYEAVAAHAEYDERVAATEPLAEFEFQTDETHQPVDPFTWPEQESTKPRDYEDVLTTVEAPMYCSVRSAVVPICGHFEWDYDVGLGVGGSTPPKVYKSATISGSFMSGTVYGGGPPAVASAGVRGDPTGSWVYNDDCSSFVNTVLYNQRQGDCPVDIGEPISSDPNGITFVTELYQGTVGGGSHFARIDTHTLRRYIGNNGTDLSCVGPADNPSTGLIEILLEDEHTEEDAIAQLFAELAENGYDEYKVMLDVEGGCGAGGCCAAWWEAREEGFEISYKDARVKLVKTGLDPDGLYVVKVEFSRALYGTIDWELYSSEYYEVAVTAGGEVDPDAYIQIPNLRGYHTYVSAYYFSKV